MSPSDWPAACYKPLPVGFDPKKDLDPCSLNGKILRPASVKGALVPGTVLTDLTDTAPPGPSGLDNLEAVFPGAVDDWFHMLNQGYRHTVIAASDSNTFIFGRYDNTLIATLNRGGSPAVVDDALIISSPATGTVSAWAAQPAITWSRVNGTSIVQIADESNNRSMCSRRRNTAVRPSARW